MRLSGGAQHTQKGFQTLCPLIFGSEKELRRSRVPLSPKEDTWMLLNSAVLHYLIEMPLVFLSRAREIKRDLKRLTV